MENNEVKNELLQSLLQVRHPFKFLSQLCHIVDDARPGTRNKFFFSGGCRSKYNGILLAECFYSESTGFDYINSFKEGRV